MHYARRWRFERNARARATLLPTVKRLYAPIGDKPVPTNTWSCSITEPVLHERHDATLITFRLA